MFYKCDRQPIIIDEDVNARLKNLPAIISEDDAKRAIAEFLNYNLGFCWELLTTGFLPEFQEMVIKGWFKKDYNLYVASRGLGKTFLIAIFCILHAIFHPNTQIVIISANFRAVKRIFATIEKFLDKNILLAENFILPYQKSPDQMVLRRIGGGEIIGLPLSGEGLRGTRAQVLIIDEGLLISKEIQEVILRPFLASNLDLESQRPIIEKENQLIAEGLMHEDERTIFRKNKLIICSSASFQFEYLYKEIFMKYLKILSDTHSGLLSDPSYFVARSSYHIGLKHKIIQEDVIKAAEEGGGLEDPITAKEYWAQFAEGSGGFFNVKACKECQIPRGEFPCIELEGNKNDEYILAIDPSYSSEKDRDFFAMAIYKVFRDEQRIMLVHSYGRAGGTVADHFNYLTFLITRFNIIFLIIDATGTDGGFIKDYNESFVARDKNIKLDFVDCDFTKQNQEYQLELSKFREQYNISGKRFVYKHIFSNTTNRLTNESLQMAINDHRVWFASPMEAHEKQFNRHKGWLMPYEFKDKLGVNYQNTPDFIRDQDWWIEETIAQVALVRMFPTENSVKFDLPSHCRTSTDENRPRKDHYTVMLLANYAFKNLLEIWKPVDNNGYNPGEVYLAAF